MLIDTTRNYELVNNYCVNYKLMTSASPSPCFDLMMDYAIEIVLNNARTSTTLDIAASCPIQGLYDTIQKIETEWSSVSNRPYKAIITLTDGQVNDTSGNIGNVLILGFIIGEQITSLLTTSNAKGTSSSSSPFSTTDT